VTDLMSGVIRTLQVNPDRMREEVNNSYAQSTDLAEHLTQLLDVDYRTAYFVVGDVVRKASRAGIRGRDLTAQMVNEAAVQRTGAHWELVDDDLRPVLDPARIVASRQALGGAAAEPVHRMLQSTAADAEAVAAAAGARLARFTAAEDGLLARVRAVLGARPRPTPDDDPPPGGPP
jgi:argininosuccinate lyase